MLRAAVGSWVLILMVSALVVSGGLWGADQSGTPLRAAPPSPPVPGTCLDAFGRPAPVPCRDHHVAEVVSAWSARPAEPLDRTLRGVDDDQGRCRSAAAAHIGTPAPISWSEGVVWSWSTTSWQTRLIRGPFTPAVPGWSWTACVVETTNQYGTPLAVESSLRGLGLDPTAELAEGWRACARDDQPMEWQPCHEPHRAEFVATARIALPEEEARTLADSQRLSQTPRGDFGDLLPVYERTAALDYWHPAAEPECRRLVEQYLGGAAALEAADLEVTVSFPSIHWVADENAVARGLLDNPRSSFASAWRPAGVVGDCRVTATGGRTLVGSVAGVGNGPLPWE